MTGARTLSRSASEVRRALKHEATNHYDLVVIGGGITAAGVFHLAAAQGLKVLLLEQQDFAWGTSSRSSKMVHGGLRYLASAQWRLTRDSTRQRELLLRELPGLVELMPFMMMHKAGEFPPAPLFHGLLSLYDKLAGCRYHRPLSLDTAKDWLDGFAFDDINAVSLFADGVTDDARLVLRLLQDGVLAGGQALNYAKVSSLTQTGDNVSGVRLQLGEQAFNVSAHCVINATGSWAAQLHPLSGGQLRPLRGSHLVFPFERLPIPACLSFFHPKDKRPVFAYPWQGSTVIGTTDLDHRQDLAGEPGISRTEIDYLMQLTREFFPGHQLTEKDVISCWSGVRPIFSDGAQQSPSKESREHHIWSKPGLISVTGGKLTSYHLMAQEVLQQVGEQQPQLRIKAGHAAFSRPTQGYAEKRLTGYFGHFAPAISAMSGQEKIGVSHYQWRELAWSAEHESVHHLDDLLLRRSRLALLLGRDVLRYRQQILSLCRRALSWSAERADSEWQRFEEIFARHYQLPSKESIHG
ncbi:glycerol-3-phosphate dehydrogenase [Sinobacterium caligoides]|uniref:Glycerol-3-phosphate dehydrogenase n=1 Tax=Sinobacterium caligoides TaxID=933926 RepID=A0A3N2E1C1_9GAMM|nr:glycerol-3-phosphate dehydrogenase/oxidase [Sinobacterium caligoides]ROS05365.1 glycerol-3-phosphate dehydrogenase [Sinobacterium caligoides]